MKTIDYDDHNCNRLSDHDMLIDLMYTEKYLSMLYDRAINETNDTSVANKLEKMQQTEHLNVQRLTGAVKGRRWSKPFSQPAETKALYPNIRTSQRPTAPFSKTASSDYAVKSGTRRLGQHLTGSLSESGRYRLRDVFS